jgi:hypothetical protein
LKIHHLATLSPIPAEQNALRSVQLTFASAATLEKVFASASLKCQNLFCRTSGNIFLDLFKVAFFSQKNGKTKTAKMNSKG